MEYTIKKLAEIAGISSRTLRYYDEIGLLKPQSINSSGYRIYGEKEVDMLQQILFYRAMDMKLEDIKSLILRPDFNINKALEEHHKRLISKRNQIEQLILMVEKTLLYKKGNVEMSNKEKFEAFKIEKLKENEEKYGKEIREKYSEEKVEESNKKWMNISEEDMDKMQLVEAEMFNALEEVIKTRDLDSISAKTVYEKHKQWLCFSWPVYSKESHRGLAEMYVQDERFSRYYNDRVGSDAVTILRDIILKYTK